MEITLEDVLERAQSIHQLVARSIDTAEAVAGTLGDMESSVQTCSILRTEMFCGCVELTQSANQSVDITQSGKSRRQNFIRLRSCVCRVVIDNRRTLSAEQQFFNSHLPVHRRLHYGNINHFVYLLFCFIEKGSALQQTHQVQ